MDQQHSDPRHKMTVKVVDALRTIQGYTIEEYRLARAELMDELQGDVELVQLAKAVSAAGPLLAHGSSQPSGQGATAVAQPVAPVAAPPSDWSPTAQTTPPPSPSFAQATVPQCAHGPRTARSGQGAKGPWKAWFCSQPKGAQQCDAVWVQRNSPEWNAFPA